MLNRARVMLFNVFPQADLSTASLVKSEKIKGLMFVAVVFLLSWGSLAISSKCGGA